MIASWLCLRRPFRAPHSSNSVIIILFCHRPPALSSSSSSVIIILFCHRPPALSSSSSSVMVILFCHRPPALSSSPSSVIVLQLCHPPPTLSSSNLPFRRRRPLIKYVVVSIHAILHQIVVSVILFSFTPPMPEIIILSGNKKSVMCSMQRAMAK